MWLTASLALVFFCASGNGFSESAPIPSRSAPIRTLPGSYVSLVRQGRDSCFFSEQVEGGKANAAGKTCPGISVYAASGKDFTRASFLKTVAPNSLINDVFRAPGVLDPARLVTRLGVQYDGKDRKFYAVGYVSRGYPPADGQVVPAMFQSSTSDVCGAWEYLGKIHPDGKPLQCWGSGGNLLVNEDHGAAVNHQLPLANKFVHYIDAKPKSLFLIYSNDGTGWFFYKDALGNPADLRPSEFQSDAAWIFPSVVRTKKDGLFMAITVGWPPQGHRLLHSDDGLTWRVVGDGALETNVGGLSQAKNLSLGYDEPGDTLHLIITRTGSDHYKQIASVKPRALAAAAPGR